MSTDEALVSPEVVDLPPAPPPDGDLAPDDDGVGWEEETSPAGAGEELPPPDSPGGLSPSFAGLEATQAADELSGRYVAVAGGVIRKVQAVFVPPPQYLHQHTLITAGQRLWVVSGERRSGRFTCALHLGLELIGQGRLLARYLPAAEGVAPSHEQLLSTYGKGVGLLRAALDERQGSGEVEEAQIALASFEMQLHDNLSQIPDENLRAARQRVLTELNLLALKLYRRSFPDLCYWTAPKAALIRSAALPPTPRVVVLQPAPGDTADLAGLIQGCETQPGTIFLCEWALEWGLDAAPLGPALQAQLAADDCYLILTTHLADQDLAAYPLPTISTRTSQPSDEVLFLDRVLESSLDYYASVDRLPVALHAAIEQARERGLLLRLPRPSTIDTFCAQLRTLSPGASREDVLALADAVGHVDLATARVWFEGLSANGRLYAMLIALFDGVEQPHLDELYLRAVRYLRQDGVEGFSDPRAQSLTELRDQTRVSGSAAGGLQLSHGALAGEVQRQLASYHPLLWSVCEQIVLPMVTSDELPAAVPPRASLGAAIGRVGVYQPQKLSVLLDALASGERRSVAATAGHILAAVVRAEPARTAWVTAKIGAWARSQEPERMWAASAASWRVYGVVADIAGSPTVLQRSEALAELSASLTELATHPGRFDEAARLRAEQRATRGKRWQRLEPDHHPTAGRKQDGAWEHDEAWNRQRLRDAELERLEAEQVQAVLYALSKIAQRFAPEAVQLLSEWLQASPRSSQHRVGRLAVRRLVGSRLRVGEERPRLSVDRHEPLLGLIGPILAVDSDAFHQLLRDLRPWVLQDGWGERVHRALLDTAAHADLADRRRLAATLRELWADAEPPVAAIAHSVVTRVRLLDGWPADGAGGDPAVILAEQGGPEARWGTLGPRLARRVAAQLAAVSPVAEASLGAVRHRASVPGPLAAPRLAAPALEAAGGPESALALVLTWGPVLDLEDLGHGRWAGRALLTALGAELPCPPGVTPVPLPARRTIGQAAELIVEAALARLAQGMAARDAAAWWRRVAPDLGLARPDLRAILARLGAWVAELGQPPASPEADPLRKIIATVCWLSAADLRGCVGLLLRWLAAEDEGLRLAGGAAARALLRLYGGAAPPPAATHAGLLRLLAPLAPQGLPGAEAALFAARRWARDPAWAERLLDPPGGGPPEILQMIDALGAADRAALAPLLERWGEPLLGEAPDPLPAPVALVREALTLHLGRGPAAALPPLAPGQGYGLLVLASSARRRAAVAREAARAILARHGGATVPVILRLGRSAPLACITPGDDPDALALEPRGDPPPLLGPLLEWARPEQVRFVVLIGETAPLDEGDWGVTAWAERLYVYREGPAGRGARPIPPGRTAAEGGEAIAAYLAPRAAWG